MRRSQNTVLRETSTTGRGTLFGADPGKSEPKSLSTLNYSDNDIDSLQKKLTRKNILDLWSEMRKGGNSKDGRVTHDKYRIIMHDIFGRDPDGGRPQRINDELIEAIFRRFRKRNFEEEVSQQQQQLQSQLARKSELNMVSEIDLHDLAVSLSIMSNLKYWDKIRLILEITDIDEDGCLSPSDIFKMIMAIERNFSKESSFIHTESGVSMQNLATKKAIRRFGFAFPEDEQMTTLKKKKKKKMGGEPRDYDTIIREIKKKESRFGSLLPKDTPIRETLGNILDYPELELHFMDKEELGDFNKFTSNLHDMLWLRNQEKKGNLKKENKNTKDETAQLPIHLNYTFISDHIDKKVEVEMEKKGFSKIKFDDDYGQNEKTGYEVHKDRLLKMRNMEFKKLEDNQLEKLGKKKKSDFHHREDDEEQKKQADFLKSLEQKTNDYDEIIKSRVERLKRTVGYRDDKFKELLESKFKLETKDRSPTKPQMKFGSGHTFSKVERVVKF